MHSCIAPPYLEASFASLPSLYEDSSPIHCEYGRTPRIRDLQSPGHWHSVNFIDHQLWNSWLASSCRKCKPPFLRRFCGLSLRPSLYCAGLAERVGSSFPKSLQTNKLLTLVNPPIFQHMFPNSLGTPHFVTMNVWNRNLFSYKKTCGNGIVFVTSWRLNQFGTSTSIIYLPSQSIGPIIVIYDPYQSSNKRFEIIQSESSYFNHVTIQKLTT